MRPDRIVLGECRGPEVREVLAALNTGHEGSMATIHANCCSNVPARLVALGSLAGLDRRAVAVQAAAALGAVIHLARVGPQAGLTEAAPAGMRTQSESGGSAQRAGIVAAVRATTGPQAGSDRSIHRARRAVTELALFRLVGSELEALPAVVWSPDGPRTGPGWQALITRLSRAIGDDQRFDGLLRSERQASQGDERQASQGDLA
jgi:hypothetical protein